MLVSIITINYNNLEGLKKTRESILAQTYKEWEWIVIDGGSTNGDREFIEAHQEEIAYWCSEKDKGVYNAQNKGIAVAKGDYFIFMNSGDTFYNADVLASVFVEPKVDDVIYGDWIQVFDNGETRMMSAPKVFSFYFICTDNICHQAMFLKGTLMKQSPYDESFKLYGDWAKWIEWTLKGYSFKYVPVIICSYQMGGMSVNQKQLIEKETQRLHTEVIPSAMQISIEEMDKLMKTPDRMHPLSKEADRLIKKKNIYRKMIHMTIRLIHLME